MVPALETVLNRQRFPPETETDQLSQLYKKINDTLHLDVDLKDADAIWSSAENKAKAFELGNRKVIGRGENMMEDQDIGAWAADPRRTLEERAAALEGLSQRGKSEIRDIAANRNEGKAFANKFGTENNIARMEALNVDGNIVRNMEARENLLGDTSNTILRGSDTARTGLAGDTYPQPGGKGAGMLPGAAAGTAGLSSAIMGLISGMDAGTIAMLTTAMGGGAAGITKALTALRDKGLVKTAQGSADLLARQGPAVKQLLDALDRVKAGKSSSTPWKDHGALQALIAAQIAGRARETQPGPR